MTNAQHPEVKDGEEVAAQIAQLAHDAGWSWFGGMSDILAPGEPVIALYVPKEIVRAFIGAALATGASS